MAGKGSPTAEQIDKYLAATPEQQAKLDAFANAQYDQTLATPAVDWNTTHQGAQVDYRSQENQPGSASLTQSGANTGNLQPMFTSYYQPMGGSTFIGVKADGSKEFITENQARDMGFVPNPRQSGDFYDLTNT